MEKNREKRQRREGVGEKNKVIISGKRTEDKETRGEEREGRKEKGRRK